MSNTYTHTQTTASTTWTIAHGMNGYPVSDLIFTDSTGARQKFLPTKIVYTDANTITVTFSTAYAGKATLAGPNVFRLGGGI